MTTDENMFITYDTMNNKTRVASMQRQESQRKLVITIMFVRMKFKKQPLEKR